MQLAVKVDVAAGERVVVHLYGQDVPPLMEVSRGEGEDTLVGCIACVVGAGEAVFGTGTDTKTVNIFAVKIEAESVVYAVVELVDSLWRGGLFDVEAFAEIVGCTLLAGVASVVQTGGD